MQLIIIRISIIIKYAQQIYRIFDGPTSVSASHRVGRAAGVTQRLAPVSTRSLGHSGRRSNRLTLQTNLLGAS